MKYRKKPVVVDAFQFNENFMRIGANCEGVPDWGINAYDDGIIYFDKDDNCQIQTLEGNHHVSVGDYIIRGVAGELYPCKPDIFSKTYETVCVGPMEDEEIKSKWIPCSESLPDEGESDFYPAVHVTTREGLLNWGFYRTDEKSWYVFIDEEQEWQPAMSGFVIAWMPPPEPYKGE